jgi:hypothetical protein
LKKPGPLIPKKGIFCKVKVQCVEQCSCIVGVVFIPRKKAVFRRTSLTNPPTANTLFYGDNLTILREYIPDAGIDLSAFQKAARVKKDDGKQGRLL